MDIICTCSNNIYHYADNMMNLFKIEVNDLVSHISIIKLDDLIKDIYKPVILEMKYDDFYLEVDRYQIIRVLNNINYDRKQK